MANTYITINEGTGGYNKRFRAITMKPIIRPSKSIEDTLGGYAASFGPIYESFKYVLKVPWASTNTDYGTFKELLEMFRRNNPNASPSPRFTFTDHYGTSHTDAMFGPEGVEIEAMTTMIDTNGNESSYLVPVTILLAPNDKIAPITA